MVPKDELPGIFCKTHVNAVRRSIFSSVVSRSPFTIAKMAAKLRKYFGHYIWGLDSRQIEL